MVSLQQTQCTVRFDTEQQGAHHTEKQAKKTKTKHGCCRLSSVFFSKEKNSGQNKYKINNSTTEKLGNKAMAHETHERAEEHNQTSARYNSWITTFL